MTDDDAKPCAWCGRNTKLQWKVQARWPHGLKTTAIESLCAPCASAVVAEVYRRGALRSSVTRLTPIEAR